MYGNAQADAELQGPKPPIEPVSAVNQNTISILEDANRHASILLCKVRGSQPESTSGKLEKMPERHLLGDARTMRNLASDLFQKLTEVAGYIGHDKQ